MTEVTRRRGRWPRTAVVAAAVLAGALPVPLLVQSPSNAVTGDLGSSFASRTPAMAVNGDGRMELFATDSYDTLMHRWQTQAGGGTWTGWNAFDGQLRSVAAEANDNRSVQVFGVNKDGRLWTRWQREGGWSTWALLDDGVNSVAVARQGDGRLMLVLTSPDGRVWERRQVTRNVNEWTGRSLLDGELRTVAAQANQDGRVELVGVNRAGQVWHRWQQTVNGGWSSWSAFDGSMTSVAVARNGDGRLELFATNYQGRIYQRFQTAAGVNSWSSWTDLSPPTKVRAVTAEAHRAGDGRIAVVAVTAAGRFMHRTQITTGGWTDWSTLPGGLTAPFAGGGTVRLLDPEERIAGADVVTGADGLGFVAYVTEATGVPGELKVAHCADLDCSVMTRARVPHASHVGSRVAIAVGWDGFPVIGFTEKRPEHSWRVIRGIRCHNVACTANSPFEIEANDPINEKLDVTISGDGHPVFAFSLDYNDASTGEPIRTARCTDQACTDTRKAFVGHLNAYGDEIDIDTPGDGRPAITVKGRSNTPVRYTCVTMACDSSRGLQLTNTTAYGIAQYPLRDDVTMTFYSNIGSTWESGLYALRCARLSCAETRELLGGAVLEVDAVEGDDGSPLVSYRTTDDDLNVLTCSDALCGGALTHATIGRGGIRGESHVTIGADGLPLVVFLDNDRRLLTVAHCNNPACTGFPVAGDPTQSPPAPPPTTAPTRGG